MNDQNTMRIIKLQVAKDYLEGNISTFYMSPQDILSVLGTTGLKFPLSEDNRRMLLSKVDSELQKLHAQ